MQKLLRQALVISGLAALGITSSAGVSHAGTATLNLNQNVALDCTFNSPTYTNNSGNVAYTGGFANSVTWEGSVDIACNHGGNVQINATSPTVSPAVTAARSLTTYTGEYLSIGGANGTNIWKNGNYLAQPSVTLAPGTIGYKVQLNTTPGVNGPGLANGAYSYSFTLTATPN
jgi:hypothetical protein